MKKAKFPKDLKILPAVKTSMKRGSLNLSHKKGVLGIETLIIFIAMILVAAVAAGVLIRTSGILQQRALTVSSETITRVATGMETIQITGNADTLAHSLQEIEMLMRLSAGSEAIQLGEVGLSYISEQIYSTASLAHHQITRQVEFPVSSVNTTEKITLYNLDNDPGDSRVDEMRFVQNVEGHDGFEFTLTAAGIINVSLGLNLSNNNNVHIENLPIRREGEEEIFGYIDLDGSFGAVTTGIDNSNSDHNFTLLIKKYPSVCNFDLLRPDIDFCVVARIGNQDAVFQTGEILMFLYKLSEGNKLRPDTRVEISLIPAKAIVSTISFYTREAFPTYKINLWP